MSNESVNEKKNENQTEQEKFESSQKDRKDLFKTIALIGVFILIISFHFLKGYWHSGNAPASPEVIEKVPPDSTLPGEVLSEAKFIKVDHNSDNLLVSDDGRDVVTFAPGEVLAYNTTSNKVIELKNVAGDLFRTGDLLPGQKLALGGESGAGVWDLMTGDKKLYLSAPGGVETLAASPDGQLIAGVSREDGRIWIWETTRGMLVKESKGNIDSLRPAMIFRDSKTLAVYEISESRSRIFQLDITTMREFGGEWRENGETDVRFGVGGQWLEGGVTNRAVPEPQLFVYDGKTGAPAGIIKLGEDGTGKMVDDDRAIVVNNNGQIKLVDLKNGNIMGITNLKNQAQLAGVSKQGTIAVIKTEDSKALILPIKNNY